MRSWHSHSWPRNSCAFYANQSSLLCSQGPATDHYSYRFESSPNAYIPFLTSILLLLVALCIHITIFT